MESLKRTKWVRGACTALFAALTGLGGLASSSLPDGIPVTVQNMFAALSGLLLGGLQGAGAVGLFLLLGAAGLPVFPGCRGGVTVLQEPAGGFLLGYFFAALAGGLLAGSPVKDERKGRAFLPRLAAAAVLAFALQYIFGIPWFMASMEAGGNARPLSQVLAADLLPLLPGDVLKMLLSFVLAIFLRPVAARHLYPDDGGEAEELLRRLEARKAGRKK